MLNIFKKSDEANELRTKFQKLKSSIHTKVTQREALYSNDIISMLTSKDGEIKRVSKKLAELLGYSSSELYNQKYIDLVHLNDKQKFIAALEKAKTESVSITSRLLTKSGECINLNLSLNPNQDCLFTQATTI